MSAVTNASSYSGAIEAISDATIGSGSGESGICTGDSGINSSGVMGDTCDGGGTSGSGVKGSGVSGGRGGGSGV